MQTSVSSQFVKGVAGQLADDTRHKDCRSARNGEASAEIPFGLMVAMMFDKALVYADRVFTAEADTEILTTINAHSLETGDGPLQVSNAGGALPNGLTALTDYYVIRIDARNFYLATTRANALAGTKVSFTTDGTGTQTISDTASTTRLAGANDVKLASSTTDTLAGIAVFSHGFAKPSELGDDGITPETAFSILNRGRIFVTVEDDVDTDDQVHVRMVDGDAAEPAGSFGPAVTANALVVADFDFTAANGTEIFTAAAHGLSTGDGPFQVSNAGGALPIGLAALTDYWVIKIDANTFYLATSQANALAGTHLLITGDGTGTQTMHDTGSTERVTSLNLSKFARWKDAAAQGEIATLEIKMVNGSMATLG